jgi:hypothetical protein
MAGQSTLSAASLSLDLNNYRILPQKDEVDALKAIVAINQDRFWALVESLLEDGYHPTDNILLLKTGKAGKTLVVKEGNRRIAGIKLILGILPGDGLNIPGNIQTAMASASDEVKDRVREVPCLVYEPSESAVLDKFVTRIHGKGDKASRSEWTAVAKARHNRIKNPGDEPALDMLESYLKIGRNLQPNQKELWAGDYPVTILHEALQKLAPRLGLRNGREVSDQYASSTYRTNLEMVLLAVGEKTLSFKAIRDDKVDVFATKFGFPANGGDGSGSSPQDAAGTGAGNGAKESTNGGGASGGQDGPGGSGAQPGGSPVPQPQPAAGKKPKAKASTDPASVIQALKKFKPKGANRGKVVTLLNEAVTLTLDSDGQPHAFCFLLRSMFELSAKAYCDDYAADGLAYTDKKTGRDIELIKVLRKVADHLTDNGNDKTVERRLKGALAELDNPNGFLSVHSMNQLIHHPSFSVDGPHISVVFHNVFPLLEAMNA